MITYDKLQNKLDPQILQTITQLANEGNRAQLEKWLKECREEITFRTQEKLEGISELILEKTYLEYILN